MVRMMMTLIGDWLSEMGPTHPKHRGWYHPITVCLLHYAVVFAVTFWTHDVLVRNLTTSTTSSTTSMADSFQQEVVNTTSSIYYSAQEDSKEEPSSSHVGVVGIVCPCLLLYSMWLLMWRLAYHHPRHFGNCVLYEYCWLCNMTLNLSAVGLYCQRPVIAGACCVVVGIDQLMWYVDLTVYFLTGKFPVGVSKYVFWEGTNWKTRITCTHHLWTMPVLLYTSRGLHWISFPLGIVVMITNVLLSRWMTPLHVFLPPSTLDDCNDDVIKIKDNPVSTPNDKKYLNVNLSHELWKDISIRHLQISKDNPPARVYLWRLLWRWTGFNALVFGALYYACLVLFGEAPIVL
jgi:hypothetical protein